MSVNVGKIDKIIRVLLGVVLFIVALLGSQGSVVQGILIIAGLIAIVTSLVSFCPLYGLLGISTGNVEKRS